MRRVAIAAGVVAIMAWPGSAAEPLYRAEASAAAVHGFFDHEGLAPVPLLNLSVPHAEAALEPGPATRALASFLWEPEAADLGTIMCVLSEGQFCAIPDYPFRAEATHPSGGGSSSPPELAIEDPAAPVVTAAAHQEAEADRNGAGGRGAVHRLAAVPMAAEQRAAARGLAAAVRAAGRDATPERWLVSVGTAVSTAVVGAGDEGVSSRARSAVRELSLLGGMITAEEVRGEARAAPDGDGRARATLASLRVGGMEAEVGPGGISIVDQEVPAEMRKAVDAAVKDALRGAGLEVLPGRERVRRSDAATSAEAFALTVGFRRQLLPEAFPDEVRGTDVLRVPLGWAVASVEVAAVGGTAGTGPPALPPASAPIEPSPPPRDPVPEPMAPEDAESIGALAAEPSGAFSNLGVPGVAVVVVALGALGLVGLLTWLRVNEVLTE
jgi:hypothetical protein